jgi:hypothetical protein
MTYDEFKDYVVTHLWKMGDSVVIDKLDTIITTAESELNRTFKVEDREKIAILTTYLDFIDLPADYRELRHVYTDAGPMKYLIPADFTDQRARGQHTQYGYTVVNKTLRFLEGGTTLNPGTVSRTYKVLYYANLPKFKDNDESWMADDYFDVYLYCVLKHTAPFLREDDRIPTWQTYFGDAFATAMTENDDRKYAGSPLKVKFPLGVR